MVPGAKLRVLDKELMIGNAVVQCTALSQSRHSLIVYLLLLH